MIIAAGVWRTELGGMHKRGRRDHLEATDVSQMRDDAGFNQEVD